MLKDWRITVFFALVLVFAVWIRWWASLAFPLEHEICGEAKAGNDCDSYNVILYSAWALAKSVDHYSALLTAIATVFVAWFTWTLYQSSEKMWRVSKVSADAAAQSAEAQVAVEGGRLICQPVNSSFWDEVGQWADRWPNSPSMPLNRRISVWFVLKNYGKTPATIRAVNAVVTKSPEEPPSIFITTPYLDLPSETVVGSGLPSSEFRVEFSQFFMLAEAIEVMNGEQNLWFYGRIVYDDVFGREGTQVFLYRVKPRGSFSLYWDRTTYRNK
jgi:hypothetical protein